MTINVSTTEILAIRELDVRLRKSYASSMQECYAYWALTQLSNGLSSYYLCILAGMTWKDNYFEADAFFLTALKELHIPIPSKEDAIRNFAIDVCEKILNEEISTGAGCNILANISIETNYDDYDVWHYLENNDYWCYLSEEASSVRFNKEVKQEAQSFLEQHKRKTL